MADELEDLRREVEQLRQQLNELGEVLRSASVAMQYRDDEAWEAFQTQNCIGGERRRVLWLAVGAVLYRARTGRAKRLGPMAQELLRRFSDSETLLQDGPIDRAEAERLLGKVLGDKQLGTQALAAHRARGLGRAAHEALGD